MCTHLRVYAHTQGFELYGALRMGLAEDDAECLVNPTGLMREEEELLEGQVRQEGKKQLSWDPKVLMERERQREYKVLGFFCAPPRGVCVSSALLTRTRCASPKGHRHKLMHRK